MRASPAGAVRASLSRVAFCRPYPLAPSALVGSQIGSRGSASPQAVISSALRASRSAEFPSTGRQARQITILNKYKQLKQLSTSGKQRNTFRRSLAAVAKGRGQCSRSLWHTGPDDAEKDDRDRCLLKQTGKCLSLLEPRRSD
jgi:hypothetical protein